MTFREAAADLEALAKSRRAQTLRAMSDAKDYDDADLDDSDRRPQGSRRRDMREANAGWRGIQALDDDELFALGDELDDESHMMLVSGRPSRIRFPGAKGDSTLHPIDEDGYLITDEEDPDDEREGRGRLRRRNAELRSTLGGDAQSWRSQANRRGVGEDEYATGKSFGFRNRARGLTPADLLDGRIYQVIKSKLQDALSDGLDPNVVMQWESIDPRLGVSPLPLIKALSFVPARIRRKYGIPALTWDPFKGDELHRAA